MQPEALAVPSSWLHAKFGVDCAIVRALRAALGQEQHGIATASEIAQRAGFDMRTVLSRLHSDELAETLLAEGITHSMNPARSAHSGRSLVTLQRAEAA